MLYQVFETNPEEGITVARFIAPIRGPKPNTYAYEYGASDRDIFEKGFLLFNYHPDQWGGGHHYSYFGATGTRISGLSVRLMDGRKQAIDSITRGEIWKASSMRATTGSRNDGAILFVSFTPEQISKMGGIGVNVPFDRQKGQPSTLLDLVVEKDRLRLKIRDLDLLERLDSGLRTRFNSEGYLLGSTGEFFIPNMLPVEEYRDQILVFRPNIEGEGFYSYWLRDIREHREGDVSRL